MASVDLKDVYYSVPINQDHKKVLKFEWKGQLYPFTCLLNGLVCAPRLFTKFLKPALALSENRVSSRLAILTIAICKEHLRWNAGNNVMATTTLFDNLGLSIHPNKSILEPPHVLEFLSFVLNSVAMTVTRSPVKAGNIKQDCKTLLTKKQPTIREVAAVIGKLVASCPGVHIGPLFFRQLENEKTAFLKLQYGNFDATMVVSATARSDLQWWVDNIETTSKPISESKPSCSIYTDASLLGWGAVFQDHSSGGRWAPEESRMHINCLALKAVYLGLQSFCENLSHVHLIIFIGNTTAVAYINNMDGTHSLECNHIARMIWLWCLQRDIWISAAHLPGKSNLEADRASGIFRDHTEWKLDPDIFYVH